MNYYDLVISSKIDKNIYRISSVQRMSKDGELTIEEAYSILYKAINGLDANAEQSAIITLIPPAEYNDTNVITLNSIISALDNKGIRVELISVYNANSEETPVGTLVYKKLNQVGTIRNFYQANISTYLSEGVSEAQIQLDLVSDAITIPELNEILDINTIKLDFDASKKLGHPFASEELPKILNAFNVDYKIYGEF